VQTSKARKNQYDMMDENKPSNHSKSKCKSAFGQDHRSVSIGHYKLSKLYKPDLLPTIRTASQKGFESMNLTIDC
jgi:hypothetical protein